VLSVFGNSPAAARRSYAACVKAGYGQGRRPELTGGGLIRSLEKVEKRVMEIFGVKPDEFDPVICKIQESHCG
jgi:hypothetical protein